MGDIHMKLHKKKFFSQKFKLIISTKLSFTLVSFIEEEIEKKLSNKYQNQDLSYDLYSYQKN